MQNRGEQTCSFCMGFAERRRQGSVLIPFHPIHSGCLSSQKTHRSLLRVSSSSNPRDARSAHDGAVHDGTASQHIHQGVVVVADEIVVMKFLSAKTDEWFSQGVLHRNSVCGVDRGIAAVIFFAHGELHMDRDQREYHQDVGSTWLVSCRNSPTPARDIAFVLHVAAAI